MDKITVKQEIIKLLSYKNSVSGPDLEKITLLIKQNPEVIDADILSWAIIRWNDELLKTLKDAGGDFNQLDEQNGNPLWFRILNMDVQDLNKEVSIRKMLELGVDLEATNNKGQTALVWCCKNIFDDEDIDNIEILLNAGANANAIDKNGSTPLLYAYQYYNILKALLDHGANVNYQQENGLSVLLRVAGAAEGDKMEDIVNLLIEYKADANVSLNSGPKKGWTPLMRLIENNNPETAMALLNAGAKASIVSDDDSSALLLAQRNGMTDLIDKLKSKGASIDARDADRASLLHAAETENWNNVLDLSEKVLKEFPRENNLFQVVSVAHMKCKAYEKSIAFALKGLSVDFSDSLLDPLFYSLIMIGKNNEVIECFNQYKDSFNPKSRFAENIVSNLIYTYSLINQTETGLQNLEPYFALITPEASLNFLTNVACIYALTRHFDNMIEYLYLAKKADCTTDKILKEPDFSYYRENEIFNYVANVKINKSLGEYRYMSDNDGYAEVILIGNKVIFHQGKLNEYGLHKETEEFESPAKAFVAYCYKRDELLKAGVEALSPPESQWVDDLADIFDKLNNIQKPVGALKMEWDFSDVENLVEYYFMAEKYDNQDDAIKIYSHYSGTDEATMLDEGYNLTSTKIETSSSFVKIVKALTKTPSYQKLKKQKPFFVSQQEHDTATDFTIVINGKNVELL
jgi:ankyrin repeat protein